jgi:hypothetical protein
VNADPASRAEHRDGAGPDPGALQHLIRGGERIRDDADLGRVRLVVEVFRQLDEDVRGKLDVLGIAPVAVAPDVAARVRAQWLEARQAPAAVAALR